MLVLWRVLEKLHEILFSLREIVKLFISNADAQQTIAVGGCRFQTELKRRERPLVVTAIVGFGTRACVTDCLRSETLLPDPELGFGLGFGLGFASAFASLTDAFGAGLDAGLFEVGRGVGLAREASAFRRATRPLGNLTARPRALHTFQERAPATR